MTEAEEIILAFVIPLAAILGLLIGSFLNVVIWRVPRGESIVHPPSACPRCGREIRWYDNIPVLSWLILRAKCRDCGEPISARYPLVEGATGIFFAVVAWWALAEADRIWLLPAFLYLAAISVALALIDMDTHTLPNAIVLPGYLVLPVLLLPATVISGDWGALLSAAIGGAVLWVIYFLLAIARPGGMGFGDVKLAGVLGIALGYLGWGPLIVGAFSAFLFGGLFGAILLATRRVGRKGGIPFGPWMLLGAWFGTFLGDFVATWYLQLFDLAR